MTAELTSSKHVTSTEFTSHQKSTTGNILAISSMHLYTVVLFAR